MIRIARFIAVTVLGLLLVSGSIYWLAVSPDLSSRLGPLPGVIWLMPIAAVTLLLVLNRGGRLVLGRIAESPAHLAVSVLALLGFIFTLLPWKAASSWMATYLAVASTVLALLLAVGYTILERFRAVAWPAVWFLLHRLHPGFFLLLASGVVLAATNLLSWRVFQHIPHVVDSIAQVFQGRVFASGRISLPVRFDEYFCGIPAVINDGARMYSQYPFGHSLLLAVGTLIRAEWLVNPLLGSAVIIVLYFLGRELYDEKTGRIAALLGVFSPFLLIMSSEYMNHASALLFLSLFLLFFFRTARPLRGVPCTTRFSDPVLSGLALAMALNTRPLSALAVAVPIAGYGIHLLLKSRGRMLPAFLALLVPVLLGLGAFGLYNYLTTGSPLLSGYDAHGMLKDLHARSGLGFGVQGPAGTPPHTPLRGLIQTGDNLNALNLNLFEGPVPGLLGVLMLFVAFTLNPFDWVLLASFVALPLLYFFYWSQGLVFGPRFLYEGLAPILLLSARGLTEFPRFVGRAAGTDAEARTRTAVTMAAAFSLAVTAAFGLPRLITRYGYRCYGVDNRVHARAVERHLSNAVVFVGPTRSIYYGAGFLNNTLDFGGPVVYARDRGAENYLLMRRFPGRAYYYADPWTFFRITDTNSFRNAPEIQDLEQAGQFVRQDRASGRRFVLLPYREAGAFVDTGTTPCRTFREVSYELLRGLSKPTDYLPAIAVFMPSDSRRYLPLFEAMRERRDYVADGCRFTLLFSADSGRSVVYDIRAVGDYDKSADR